MFLCTHLHFDHCGWNTRLLDGRWVPTFPNARYIIARRELEAAQLAAVDKKDGVYEENVLPIIAAGQAVFVDMDHALDDEVWLEPTPGHTMRSTGPRSTESKATLARNAFKGVQRPKLRQLIKLLRRELKGQRIYLERIHW